MAWKIFKAIDQAYNWVADQLKKSKDENQYFPSMDVEDEFSAGNSWNQGENQQVANVTHDEELMLWVAHFSLTETVKYFLGTGGKKPPPLPTSIQAYKMPIIVVVVLILVLYLFDD